jgi:sialate O-acetylesterase
VQEDPHAALTVTVDIGDATNLHPTNKQEVGRRLAQAARAAVYGERVPPSGPAPAGVSRRGADVVIAFRDVGGTLLGRSGNPNGFELCGATQASCRWADSRIEGNNVVLVNARDATRVRYCWGEAPVCTLYDGSGLPAGPFEAAIRN